MAASRAVSAVLAFWARMLRFRSSTGGFGDGPSCPRIDGLPWPIFWSGWDIFTEGWYRVTSESRSTDQCNNTAKRWARRQMRLLTGLSYSESSSLSIVTPPSDVLTPSFVQTNLTRLCHVVRRALRRLHCHRLQRRSGCSLDTVLTSWVVCIRMQSIQLWSTAHHSVYSDIHCTTVSSQKDAKLNFEFCWQRSKIIDIYIFPNAETGCCVTSITSRISMPWKPNRLQSDTYFLRQFVATSSRLGISTDPTSP